MGVTWKKTTALVITVSGIHDLKDVYLTVRDLPERQGLVTLTCGKHAFVAEFEDRGQTTTVSYFSTRHPDALFRDFKPTHWARPDGLLTEYLQRIIAAGQAGAILWLSSEEPL